MYILLILFFIVFITYFIWCGFSYNALFISEEKLNEDASKKEDLKGLYKLSDYRKTTICAPNPEKLENIINELNKKGYVLNE